MSKTCDYFISPPSPFVYLGHARFRELARAHGVQIQLKPMDLAKVFATSGGLPLAQRAPQRQAYRLVELARWSRYLGLPLNLQPKYFPVAADPACKLIIAAQLAHGTERALDLVGAISGALWADEKNIADEATLARLATGLGMDGAALVKASEGANVQATLDQNTQEAIGYQVFGAPWFQFEGEPYWGQDRLEFLGRAFAAA
ncbi:2-hydroxychromene-2-carboxylate isomerase [Pandoraea terrae]|uniref:2-hydroxychromene-2-carboxylate isomerase n=1 Tax=Pandoraea terrae TaxID=1537710 RepID=A0A5E4U0C8_9BURK|nr:2-hydroxychromene-2-carboxylate isomerase [Pandoraea terrae]VVD93530.1 2-hydroxychromene-2-carboxylate isomerase [Pandoraea terrae]